jgi:hypothetical protein
MLIIPRYTAGPSQSVKGFSNDQVSAGAGFHTINFSQIFDRSTFDNEPFKLSLFAVKNTVPIFTAMSLTGPKTASNRALSSLYCKHLYVLRLCTPD